MRTGGFVLGARRLALHARSGIIRGALANFPQLNLATIGHRNFSQKEGAVASGQLLKNLLMQVVQGREREKEGAYWMRWYCVWRGGKRESKKVWRRRGRQWGYIWNCACTGRAFVAMYGAANLAIIKTLAAEALSLSPSPSALRVLCASQSP